MQEKIKQYIDIKSKIKELENALKYLEGEIKDSITGSIVMDGYILQKKSRVSYSLKKDADMELIKTTYPGICKTNVSIDTSKIDVEIVKQQFPEAYVENTIVDAKVLYTVAVNPKELVDEKVTEYLEVREEKKKDLDF